MAEIEEVIGRYVHLTVVGEPNRIFYEEAGTGAPLLCVHTSLVHSRQYRHMLADLELLQPYRVIAFDLPWHGRSPPPDGWWKQDYRMTTARYSLTVMAFISGLGLRRPVVLVCSMAGSLVLELARSDPDELGGVIGLLGAAYGVVRFTDWATRPDVNASIAVTAWVYGLMAPQSPLRARKEVWGSYAKAACCLHRGTHSSTAKTGISAAAKPISVPPVAQFISLRENTTKRAPPMNSQTTAKAT